MTENQKKILQFIKAFVADRHYSPTLREIGEAVGMSSVASVNYNLSKLAVNGYIERGTEPRTIKVNDVFLIDGHELIAVRKEAKSELGSQIIGMIGDGATIDEIRFMLEKKAW